MANTIRLIVFSLLFHHSRASLSPTRCLQLHALTAAFEVQLLDHRPTCAHVENFLANLEQLDGCDRGYEDEDALRQGRIHRARVRQLIREVLPQTNCRALLDPRVTSVINKCIF